MKTKSLPPDFTGYVKSSLVGCRWRLPLIALLAFASPDAAVAGSWSWNATSGNWNVAGNWVSTTNPGTAPLSNTSDTLVYLTNGTGVTPAVTTLTADWIAAANSSVTVGVDNTLTLSATLIFNAATASFTNNGIVQTSANGKLRGSAATKTNNGTIQALSGGILTLWDLGTIANANGLVQAKNGGTVKFEGNTAITGGTFRTELGGTLLQDGVNSNQLLTFNGVTIDNRGTFTNDQNVTSSGVGLASLRVNLETGTLFTNAAGAVTQVRNTGSGTTTTTVARHSVFNVNAGATFRNEGTLLIQNDATRTDSLTGQASTFTVASGATEFSNKGTIHVIANTTGKGATAAFTSAKSITNEGVVRIKGNSNHEFASFSVTGAGNDYTQSGDGAQRTVLEQGGVLSAADEIVINAGALGGVGTVSGATTIGENAVLFAGETFAGAAGSGVLTFSNDLSLSDGAEIKFGLGLSTATSARVVLAGDLILGTNLTLTLSDLSEGNWVDGTTYRLFNLAAGTITGSITGFSLVLPTGWTGTLFSESGDTSYVDLTLHAVPEPYSLTLLAGSLAALAIFARRQRRQSS